MKNVAQLRTKRSGVLSGTYHELLHELSGGKPVEIFPADQALAPTSLAVDMMRRPRPGEGELEAAMSCLMTRAIFVDDFRVRTPGSAK
ncbi:hypothetical protein [Arthrobacter sp. 162MFSha1.1]|uniref:hypothetical protein n=1 Tax=Arthrobacter sp. 162MFSha1.1 TaxID=1151119 RepID=UPI00037CD095|nr:hypothetical protein [Arthrobacter sp. 162MFSha1.1]